LIPTLSRLSVRVRPESRLRHWCSSQYLRISPLHWEFHSPLLPSSYPVSEAGPELSPRFSPLTWITAYAPFTPSNSGQRSPPTFYRGCWHVVSRGFLLRYRHFHLRMDRETGGAWLSSARVVRCWVKSRNERNPYV
jgi:hypothetical protein